MALVDDLNQHVRDIIAIHFNPRTGTPYWLERERALDINARDRIQTFSDLQQLGTMDEASLAERPLLDFVPISQLHHITGAILTDTGGTTGPPKRTIFSRDEFHAAFVKPFVKIASHVNFPRDAAWLFIGPSGPHIIGQAAAACAAALGSHQPFMVDFDPRWFRKLPPDSLGRERYLQHLLDQAAHILSSESIGVLFTTPALLERLAAQMTDRQREQIRGVHYGGMRVPPSLLQIAQSQWFPNAVHLAGYGNSLFGVCMEEGGLPTRTIQYFPHGLRHQVRVAENGRVWMHRLDSTVLIANLLERDHAAPAVPSASLALMGFGDGLIDPGPPPQLAESIQIGIY